MHELLAPILWVVYQDSVDAKAVPSTASEKEGMDFMLDVLDSRYVEHDAFNLFCAVMQTAKTFYELGDNKDSSAIIAQSERIHKELLGAVDPDLSNHLEVIGIIPQIFAIRWLRLLFGREFDFKDVLKLWDILFAESLNIDIIDMACVSILLRLRWQLIDADYTTAITTITRLQLPSKGDSARAIVKDAVQLAKRRTTEAGADITQLRTGRRQYTNPLAIEEPVVRASTPTQARTHRRLKSSQISPSSSPARFATPQRQLESLFNNVSSNFQKGAEGWSVQNVSKALRGAVGEVRRNVEHLQAGTAPSRTSIDTLRNSTEDDAAIPSSIAHDLANQLRKLEDRNKALAKMLETAQESLRKWKSDSSNHNAQGEDAFNTALARIQFVSVYLTDSDIPIPTPAPTPAIEATPPDQPTTATPTSNTVQADQQANKSEQEKQADNLNSNTNTSIQPPQQQIPKTATTTEPNKSSQPQCHLDPSPLHPRPSLTSPTFSFMLGPDHATRRTSFIRSTPLPEERRHSTATSTTSTINSSKPKSSTSAAENTLNMVVKKKKTKKESKDKDRERRASLGRIGAGSDGDEDIGFTMSSLRLGGDTGGGAKPKGPL